MWAITSFVHCFACKAFHTLCDLVSIISTLSMKNKIWLRSTQGNALAFYHLERTLCPPCFGYQSRLLPAFKV